MEFFHPETTVLDKQKGVVEVTCRYCGERFFVQKGDEVGVIVGPMGAEDPKPIGYAHNICMDKCKCDDDLRLPTKKAKP